MKLRATHYIAGLALVAAAAIALFPRAGLSPQGALAAGLCLGVIGLLGTAVVPEFVAVLIFFTLAILLRVAPPSVVFSGLTSTPFWLVFGGLVISVGVRRTGLAERLAGIVARRLSTRYAMVLAGVVLLCVALALVMPSTMGRMLVLLPIVLALAEGLGFRPGSNGYNALALAVPFATMMPGFAILPATVPSVLFAGMSETLYGISINYAGFLWLHFPVLGLLKAVVIWAALVLLFPDRVRAVAETPAAGRMTRDERLMALLLLLALALWMTDVLHGVSPAWVSLGIATVCLLPFVGLVPAGEFNKEMPFATLLYLSGIIGLGAVLAASDADEVLARWVVAYLPFAPGEGVRTMLLIAGLGAAIAALTTQPGTPLLLTPLAADIARATDLPLENVLMMQVLGFSTVIFPYQTPPIVVGMQITGVPFLACLKLSLTIFVVTALLLIPLDILWWKLLGWLP
jgi:di/tricarboxylate transporter